MRNNQINKMMISAMLCAIGIIIPMFSPIKIIIEPASFTLASHVAIIIAMFISPGVAITVCAGTTLGFFLGGFPVTVVLRAASQIVFCFVGAMLIQKDHEWLDNPKKFISLVAICSLIHAIGEVLIVLPFYMNGDTSALFYSLFILVGVGTFVHSCVDFAISKAVWQVVGTRVNKTALSTNK